MIFTTRRDEMRERGGKERRERREGKRSGRGGRGGKTRFESACEGKEAFCVRNSGVDDLEE